MQKEVKDGKVMWYDMRELWYDANARPGSYGLSANPITKTCFDSSTNKLCKKPSEYLYLDTLRESTSTADRSRRDDRRYRGEDDEC